MKLRDTLLKLSIEVCNSIDEDILNYENVCKLSHFDMRVLTLSEIEELSFLFRNNLMFNNLVPLFSDDNSNYAAVYVGGPMKNKICYLDHEETDISPVFRSINSFVQAIRQNPESGWCDIPRDYPVLLEELETNRTSDDLRVIEEIRNFINKENELDENYRANLLFCIMALTPKSNLNEIIKYLYDEDMWVQERACRVLGYHKYEPATEHLKKVMENGMHNGKLAAKRALNEIKKEKFCKK